MDSLRTDSDNNSNTAVRKESLQEQDYKESILSIEVSTDPIIINRIPFGLDRWTLVFIFVFVGKRI